MSGIQGLLKYRYQKREKPQIPSAHDGPSSNGIGSTTPNKNQPDLKTVPETPESKQGSSDVSPIFQSRRPSMNRNPVASKRGAIVIQSSDSESESPTKPTEKSSSPWLSKEYGRKQNGHVSKSSKRPPPQRATVTARTATVTAACRFEDDEEDEELDEREIYQRVSTLQNMFPGVAREKLEDTVKNTRDLDHAIDCMIANQSPDISSVRKRKRVRMLSQGSTESEPSNTPVKKARPLTYNDSQESSQASQPSVSSPASTVTAAISVQNVGGERKEIGEKIEFLREAFPSIPTEILEASLREHNFSEERAAATLADYKPPPPPVPVDQTKNVGSIKAYQLARAQARVAGTTVRDEEYFGEDDDMDSDFGDSSGMRRKKKKGGKVDEDEEVISDDDSSQEGDTAMDSQILGFFNDATMEELMCMKGCSKKKAEYLKELRPYESWEDLVAKFEHSDKVPLPFTLITECKDMIRVRKTVRLLMERCERISVDLEHIIGRLASKVDLEDGDRDQGCISRQPHLINNRMQLTPYQLVGLNWLILMYRKELDGILGDEMGLGKTIQTIAFLSHLLEIGDTGPHIVIAPSSTIDNWLRELKLWCPALKVLLYYGSQEERRDIRNQLGDGTLGVFHVVVTTYNMAAGSTDDRILFKKLKFHYAVFDEGHMLKNMASMRYQSLMKIRARRRLLLTGTPLQNNLLELMSLLAFVMPDMFVGQADHLKKVFTIITNRTKDESRGAYEKEVIAHAKRILKPFFLRRLKSQVLQQMPRKSELIEKVPMAFEQQDLYDDLRRKFTDRLRSAACPLKGQSGAAMLMQLRKAANHHLLHRRVFDDTRLKQMSQLMIKEPTHCQANVDYIFEDMQVMSDFELHRLCCNFKSIEHFKLDEEQVTDSGKFRYLDELLPDLKNKGSRVLLFSQFTMMMDIMEAYLKSREHSFIRLDGATPVAERQELIDRYNTDTSIFVFLLSTKAGGLGINLTAANTVILHDIDFNPYNDKQAEDRCHRVGQTREVMVYRLISRGTIEEAMLRCGQAKLKLEEDVTGQEKGQDDMQDNDVASLLREALAESAD